MQSTQMTNTVTETPWHETPVLADTPALLETRAAATPAHDAR